MSDLRKFELSALNELDSGKAVIAFERHVQRAAMDCWDRPAEGKKRTVHLILNLEPVQDEAGECSEVRAWLAIKSSIPVHSTKLYSFGLRKNGILTFNRDSPDDVNQNTLFPEGDE